MLCKSDKPSIIIIIIWISVVCGHISVESCFQAFALPFFAFAVGCL